MFASRDGHFDVVLTLIHYQANVEIISVFGWTALKLAAQGGTPFRGAMVDLSSS